MGAFFSILPAKVQLETLDIICKTNVKVGQGRLAGDTRHHAAVSCLRLVLISYIPDSEAKKPATWIWHRTPTKPALSLARGGGKGRHSKAENFQPDNTEKRAPHHPGQQRLWVGSLDSPFARSNKGFQSLQLRRVQGLSPLPAGNEPPTPFLFHGELSVFFPRCPEQHCPCDKGQWRWSRILCPCTYGWDLRACGGCFSNMLGCYWLHQASGVSSTAPESSPPTFLHPHSCPHPQLLRDLSPLCSQNVRFKARWVSSYGRL